MNWITACMEDCGGVAFRIDYHGDIMYRFEDGTVKKQGKNGVLQTIHPKFAEGYHDWLPLKDINDAKSVRKLHTS